MKYLGLVILLLTTACSEPDENSTKPSDVETTPASTELPATTTDYLDGAWGAEQISSILDKTMFIHMELDKSAFSPAELEAMNELLAAGTRLHELYLEQRHSQGRAARFAVMSSDNQALKDLFWMNKGPIATTLTNARKPLVAVLDEEAGKNVYPAGMTREIMDAFLEANPDKRDELLDLRAAVWEANDTNKSKAINVLDVHPTLDVLHPGLRERISKARGYMGIPYSVAYADDIFFIYDRLNAAADILSDTDISYARFLRLRARDLLADNYDGGDATWVSSQFSGNLNTQIGSYETYDDALYGVKSFFSLSLLYRDKVKSNELSAAINGIQDIEDVLPYDAHKTVRSFIPVGVYNVLADFGQSRGTNTATILPNETHLSRQFGRTILIRSNILTNEALFATSLSAFNSATHDEHHEDMRIDGNFYRTLWHEIGHYLGPDATKDRGDIGIALQDTTDLLEEMKSDLVSLFSARRLHAGGQHDAARLRAIYAGGIKRVLQKNKPRRDQPYGTMKLIQMNWYLDRGLISFEDGRLRIDYSKYPDAVNSLLAAVLDLQYQGDYEAANAFVAQWTNWDDDLHGVLAQKMKGAEQYRFRLVSYEALNQEMRSN